VPEQDELDPDSLAESFPRPLLRRFTLAPLRPPLRFRESDWVPELRPWLPVYRYIERLRAGPTSRRFGHLVKLLRETGALEEEATERCRPMDFQVTACGALAEHLLFEYRSDDDLAVAGRVRDVMPPGDWGVLYLELLFGLRAAGLARRHLHRRAVTARSAARRQHAKAGVLDDLEDVVRMLKARSGDASTSVASAASPGRGGEGDLLRSWERLVMREDRGFAVAEFDGKSHRLRGTQDGEFLRRLIDAEGIPVTAYVLEAQLGKRPDRILRSLPPEIRELIDAPGRGQTGYRLR